jgi:hypothetical protein
MEVRGLFMVAQTSCTAVIIANGYDLDYEKLIFIEQSLSLTLIFRVRKHT